MKLLNIIITAQIIALLIILIVSRFLKKKRYNLKVSGKIIDRWTEEYGTHNNIAERKGFHTYILVEYYYNGKRYSKQGGISPFSKLEINDSVAVMINPNMPDEAYGFNLSKGPVVIKSRMKPKDYIFRLLLCLPLITFVGLILFFIGMLITGKFNM